DPGVRGVEDDLVDAQLRAGDLHQHGLKALPDLGRPAVDLGDRAVRTVRQRDPGLRGVVEPLAVRHVLVPDGEAHAPAQPLAPDPRVAPHGGLFVYTDVPSSIALGTS